jgi:hypothetical protein
MASTYSELGIELMATGENAGTWGTKTNANLNLVEQISGGYVEQSIAGGAQTTNLLVADGALTGKAQNRIIKLTGSITGNQIVTLPVNMENFYIINNATTDGAGTPTVQLKAISGSGATVTWAAGEKGYKIVYSDGVSTNTGIYDTGFSTTTGDVTLTGTQTLTNKTLTSPKITTSILDSNGNELFLLTATGSAVNEFTLANAATGAGPTLSSTGGDTNIDINLTPKGAGDVVLAGDTVKVGDSGAAAVLTSNGAGTLTVTTGGTENLILSTNSGTNSGNITITDGANADMNASPNGYGRFIINGQGAVQSLAEKITIEATAATGTKTFDVLTQALIYYTSNASGDWTLNVRGDGSTSLNTIMDTGESVTIAHMVTIGGSEYRNSTFQVDGSSITPEWQGGEAPTEGNVNSIDVYTYTIIKTGNAAFKVLGALTQFA